MCVKGLDWKSFRRGFLVFAIIIGLIILTGLLLKIEQSRNVSTICKDNLSCPAHWYCCDMGCCGPVTPSPRTDEDLDIPWWAFFFIPALFFGVITISFVFRRTRQYCGGFTLSCFCCGGVQHDMEVDSAGSLYPPPRYSRCGSFPQAPPPYSEVQSKPDLYPLVITCAEGDAKHGSGGSYLMVHYFRNCVIRPPQEMIAGSLSATSTAESLNSSFICNVANEANSVIPPPYNFEYGVGGRRSMLRSVSSLNEPRPAHLLINPNPYCPPNWRDALQWNDIDNMDILDMDQPYVPTQAHAIRPDRLGCEMYSESSWRRFLSHTLSEDAIFEPEAYEVRRVVQPTPIEPLDSPPQPTSPEESQKPTEDRRQRRLDSIKRNIRKSSLYMPLSTAPVRPARISPGTRTSSRSAPATPSSNLVPTLLNFTHRATRYSSRSSRLEEEYDALIKDTEQHADHKF